MKKKKKNDHVDRIPVAVKNISHLFCMASETLQYYTVLFVNTEEQMCKFSIYFDLKRYLHFKNIFYPVNIGYFL